MASRKVKKTRRVLIEIRGGALVATVADGPCEIFLADWDNIGQGEKAEDFELSPMRPDAYGVNAFYSALEEAREQAQRLRHENLQYSK